MINSAKYNIFTLLCLIPKIKFYPHSLSITIRHGTVSSFHIKNHQTVNEKILTLFRMDIFEAAHGWGGAKKVPLPKIFHTYPTMMKLGKVIPYLKKIKKIYESRDTPPEFCCHLVFSPKISKFFFILRNTDVNCILVDNF